MSGLIAYFWPAAAIGLLAGIIAGLRVFRSARLGGADQLAGTKSVIHRDPKSRRTALLGGAFAALAGAGLWHGPLGGADRLASDIEARTLAELQHLEMSAVSGRLEEKPLTRRILLEGPADDFQRGELVRIIGDLPGVSTARWSNPAEPKSGAR